MGRKDAGLQLGSDDRVEFLPVCVWVQAHDLDDARVRSPITHSTVVVLPAPFGPRMPKISPSATENDTSSTATRDPYVLRRCATSIAAPAPGAELGTAVRLLDITGAPRWDDKFIATPFPVFGFRVALVHPLL
jgi:hypothetical protein